MRNIVINGLKQTPLEQQGLEIVERKGLGHPDSICDAIMDRISVRLSKEYLEKFGMIMHHNADKSMLVAGEVETRFGGGIVKEPMLLILGDRATFEVEGVRVPVEEIAVQTAREWFKENLRFVDPEKHVRYQVELKPGSVELMDIFKRKGRVLGANDTSAAVGYAPMTKTETIVLEAERYMNSEDFKKEFPESGEDVKVMGLRRGNELRLTVSMAFVDQFVESERDYFKKKAEIHQEIENFVKEKAEFKRIVVKLNTLDVKGRGIGGVYLTVLGTSADSADSGQVGRGNRVNGVISLNRPLCSEAAAGKNPMSHVGKIYNLLTHRIANQIYEKVAGMEEVYIWLLSQIGKPIDQPAIAAAQVVMRKGNHIEDAKREIEEVINFELENIGRFCMDLAHGKIPIC
ncbi:MAG: methionine adenosyltransferase [Candidatus Bathyarchaeota archaeon]|nr:methionine adenosyltransferase [Candidatus Bathyarchaeota archaeon]MDH5532242.1 methionine adenosyltransferase [Candidatus Bathyarchaeota archaeon]